MIKYRPGAVSVRIGSDGRAVSMLSSARADLLEAITAAAGFSELSHRSSTLRSAKDSHGAIGLGVGYHAD